MTDRPHIALLARHGDDDPTEPRGTIHLTRALAESIWIAGGEPVILRPGTDQDSRNWAARLRGMTGVILPGGADINPTRYGREPDDTVYGVDDVQDTADLSLADYALTHGIPLLAICRGHQLVNVLLGGTLIVNMVTPPRHRFPHEHTITFTDGGGTHLGLPDHTHLTALCAHHQAIDTLGTGMTPIAYAEDGTIEATIIDAPNYAATVQFHPEYNYETTPDQITLLRHFLTHC